MNEISIGADPEVFYFYKGTNHPLSVHDKLPGTKKVPFIVPNGAIQVDGVAAEFNIEPAYTQKEFLLRIKSVMRLLKKAIDKNMPQPQYFELRAQPVADFNERYFNALPDEVKELGCEPDFNAYTRTVNPRPETDLPMRTGSGHVHVGWMSDYAKLGISDETHFQECCDLVSRLDFVLGKSATFWDKDERRRHLYGAYGAFRPKKYGVEYRVLSNAWLQSEETQKFVFDAAHTTTWQFINGNEMNVEEDFETFDEYCGYLAKLKLPTVRDYSIKEA